MQPVYSPGGANSAADIGKYVIDLKSALEHAGFSVNNTLFDAYSKSDTKRVASNNLQVSGDPRSNGALNDAPVLGEERHRSIPISSRPAGRTITTMSPSSCLPVKAVKTRR